MFRAAQFDKLLDKATSNLRLDTDWPTIIQICDLIRQNDCSPRYAVTSIKKKLYSQNPHQAMFALVVLESIAKNCGSVVHDEVASKATCEMLRELVKSTQHENLRAKTLELIQAWAFAFRNTPKYRAVQDTVNIMKAEGYKFPPLKESDAMFSADTAPEWSDGDVCHRCRTGFTLMVRKHHCRACGQVFCQQCSAKTSTIPKFGIEKEVRVCDACFDKMNRPSGADARAVRTESIDTASDYGPALQPQKRPAGGGKTAEELQEEEELQLALALSQSEAEQKEKEKKRPATSAPALQHNLSPSPSSTHASPEHAAQDSELSRYLDRGYWEQRRGTHASAPAQHAPPASVADNILSYTATMKAVNSLENGGADSELEEFVAALRSQIEIFVNRMKSDSSRGRSIANDTSVQTLFMNITAMHSRLLRYIQQQDDSRVHFERLQDKVSQTRDSRAALDTLRDEHAARLAAAAEAAERQRQLQMAHKLHTMRKKKHEYLQYQRQLALQRVQEQEREMQMRQEQQKQQYLMGSSGYYIQNPAMPFQHPFPHQAMFPNPQYHQGMPPDQQQPGQQMQMNQQPQISQASMMMGQPLPGMTRPGHPGQAQLPQMMMQQLRMSMPVHGMPGNVPTGPQPGAPPQSPGNSPLNKQIQPAQQLPHGQMMQSQNPGAPMNMPMGVRAPGLAQGQQMPMQQQMGPQGQPGPPMPNQIAQTSQGAAPQMGGPGQMQQQVHQNQMQQPAPMQNQMQPQAPSMQGQAPQPPQQAHQQQMVSQQQQMISQPQQMVSQPQQMVSQPQQMPSQPQQMLSQPQQMMSQPQQMVSQPQQMVSQPQQGPSQQMQTQQAGPQPPANQGQPGPVQQQRQPGPNTQPAPTNFPTSPPQPPPASAPAPSKSENPTAELISFD